MLSGRNLTIVHVFSLTASGKSSQNFTTTIHAGRHDVVGSREACVTAPSIFDCLRMAYDQQGQSRWKGTKRHENRQEPSDTSEDVKLWSVNTMCAVPRTSRVWRRFSSIADRLVICELTAATIWSSLRQEYKWKTFIFVVLSHGDACEVPFREISECTSDARGGFDGGFLRSNQRWGGKVGCTYGWNRTKRFIGESETTHSFRNHVRAYLCCTVCRRQSMVPCSSVRCERGRTAMRSLFHRLRKHWICVS